MDTRIDYTLKIITLGDSFVGKTSILYRYLKNEYNDTQKSTLGLDVTAKIVPITLKNRVVNVKLLLWDTAGDEKYNSLATAFYRGCQGAFMVYDMTRKQTFSSCQDWITRLREIEPDCKILLVGNKLDMQDKRQVSEDEGKNIASCYGAQFIETSAKSGSNVEEAFNVLIQNILEKYATTEQGQASNVIDIEDDTKKTICKC